MLKYIALGLMITQLAACANGARPEAMIAEVTTDVVITNKSPLWKSTSIKTIIGGVKVNPLWKSKVSKADFGEALKQTLALHALLNTAESSKYHIHAELQELRQPFLGFELAVTARVHYKVEDIKEKRLIFDREVTETYTAKFNQSYIFSERLKLANEGAVKANIQKFIHAYVTQNRSLTPAPDQSVKSTFESGTPASSNS